MEEDALMGGRQTFGALPRQSRGEERLPVPGISDVLPRAGGCTTPSRVGDGTPADLRLSDERPPAQLFLITNPSTVPVITMAMSVILPWHQAR